MVTVSFNDLEKLTGLYERQMDFVVKQSTADTISTASRRATGVTRGGSVKEGFVPVDKGALSASLISELSGSTYLTQGNGDFNLVIGAMESGDKASFGWNSEYAVPVHYGSRGRGGWHWVTKAVADFIPVVNKNIAKAKAFQL